MSPIADARRSVLAADRHKGEETSPLPSAGVGESGCELRRLTVLPVSPMRTCRCGLGVKQPPSSGGRTIFADEPDQGPFPDRHLNGRKLLIRGNHDKIGERLPWAEPVRDVARIHLPDPAGGSQEICLSQYAHRTWPAAHRGAIHLYGHSHGSLPGTAASTDVGVDCWDYAPVTLERIRERLAENALAEAERAGGAS